MTNIRPDELHEKFKSHYEWETRPLREFGQQSDAQAVEIGKTLIATSFLLNGGALLAIPAFLEIFSPTAVKTMSFTVFWIFTFGIASVTTGGLCAFFSLARRSDALWKRIEASGHKSWSTVYAYEGASELSKSENDKAEVYEKEFGSIWKHFQRFRIAAILFIIISYILFIVGVGIGISSVVTPEAPVKSSEIGSQ